MLLPVLVEPSDDVQIVLDGQENLKNVPVFQFLHDPKRSLKPIPYMKLRHPENLRSLLVRGRVEHHDEDFDGFGRIEVGARFDEVDKDVEHGVKIVDELKPLLDPTNIVAERRLAPMQDVLDAALLLLSHEDEIQDVAVFGVEKAEDVR